MAGGEVRWTGQSAHLHCWTSLQSLDAFRDPLPVCVALGTAKNKTGHEPGHHTSLSRGAGEWQGTARSTGMGCAVLAQCDLTRGSDCYEADARGGAIRFQLALGHGNGMLLRRDRFRISAGIGPAAIDEDLLENAGANAAGNDRDFIHVGTGLYDPLLGLGCRAGFGIHTHRMDVSILRNILGMAGSCAHRQRYIVQCPVWQPAENYFATEIG